MFAKSLYQPEFRVIQAGMENILSKNNMLKLLNAGNEIKDENYWKKHSTDDIPTIELVAQAMSTLQKTK